MKSPRNAGGKRIPALRIFLLAAGALLIGDTIFVLTRASLNFGTIAPAILGVFPLVYGIWYDKLNALCAHGFARFLRAFVIIGYAAVFVMMIVCGLLIAGALNAPAEKGADAVVVLGAGLRGNRISLVMRNRLDAAYGYLVDNPEALCVVTGGQGSGELRTEAEAEAEYLAGRGIDKDRIILEDKSTSTVQNLAFARALLDERLGDGYSVVVVSSDFHMFRALNNAVALGFNATGLGAPTPLYLMPNNFIRESAAIMKEAILGSSADDYQFF